MRTRAWPSVAAVAVMVASTVVLWPEPVSAAQGDLDPTFAKTGQVVTDLSGQVSSANAVAVLPPAGKVLTAGTTGPGEPGPASDVTLARYNDDGALDESFGTRGVVITDLYGDRDDGNAVAVRADGKIVVVGSTSGRTPGRDIAVLRYNADGTLDESFGTGGVVTTDLGGDDEAFSVALEPADETGEQKVVVGGRGVGTFAVLRYADDGSLDPSFEGDGIVLTGGYQGEYVAGLAIQPTGRIVGVGTRFNDFITFRLDGDGSVDDTFGFYGEIRHDLEQAFDEAFAVTLDPDGNILVAGRSNEMVAVIRYGPDGTVDSGFGGGNGWVRDPFPGSGSAVARSVVPVGDEIVLAGYAGDDVALARYDVQGELVPSFGGDGLVTTDVLGGRDAAFAAASSGDRLVLAGTAATALGPDSAVFRYNLNGAPDGAFGAGSGHVTTDVASATDELTAVTLDFAERAVAVGYSATGLGWDFAVTRHDADGLPDPSFGGSGKVTTDLGGDDRAYALATSADGITVAGQTEIDGVSVFALARYQSSGVNSAGTLDPTFGDGGIVRTPVEGSGGARAVAFDQSGRILAAGFVGGDLMLVRYEPDGTLSDGFGPNENGFVLTDVGESDEAWAIAVQPDGKIVVAGDYVPTADAFTGSFFGTGRRGTLAQYRGDRDFVIARYESDGALDTSFGQEGIAFIDVEFGHDEARAMAVQSDGKILVAGRVFPGQIGGIASVNGQAGRIGVIRYDPATNGLDGNFGTEGIVVTDVPGDRDGARAITVDPSDGVITVAGTSAGDLALARYGANGALDPSFGAGGVVTTDLGGHDEARAMAATSDGSAVVAGSTRRAGRTAALLAHYDAEGALDPSFGADGVLVEDVVGDLDEARAVAVQPDGKVVVAGEARSGPGGDFAVLRYNPDGTLDRTFGRGGLVLTDLSGRSDGAYAVAVQQPTGAIVAAGVADRGPGGDFAFVRYNPDGTIDSGFGDGGVTIIDIDSGSSDVARGLAIGPDGTITAAGSASLGGEGGFDDFAVARLTSTGQRHPGFNDATGRTHTGFGDSSDHAYAVAVQPDDGKIVAAGASTSFDEGGGSTRAALVRYQPDGSLDTGFGDGGRVITSLGSDMAAFALAVQPGDGKLVIAGEAGEHAMAIRYGSDGALDGTFGDGGIALTTIGVDGMANAVAIQPDGAVVLAGDGFVSDPPEGRPRELALVRLRPDGIPDPRFGERGVAFSGVAASFGEMASGVAVQPDGQLVAVGVALPAPVDQSGIGPGEGDATVLRFVGGDAGPVGPPADLSIELTASAGAVRVGEPLRYVITVRNAGPAPAEAVVVTDELPAGVTVLSTTAGQGSPCTQDGTELSCPLGSIAVGAAVGLTITVQPTAVGSLTNTAGVASDQHDPEPANDTASVTTTVLPPSSIRANPGVVPLGRVVIVLGTGFTPGAPVTIGLAGLPATRTVTPAADGTLTTPLVVFAETIPGKRVVEARSAAGDLLATTNLLVVTDTLNPPNFVGRN